ncbi:hypothetical protein WOLCODRAFT_133309 [Wolfiporia cocos MD-104 SS10]|uniref:RRM domain-containing protein n=1 Tax=Wolfiporia cocos (strain MD-104) TaxID=742152 RepID=A0A2H3K0B1_WOLCO|nr:hypothetical protein WOLCODRAFT_133309 [Wolfiporia cocos MD-104 SS10]
MDDSETIIKRIHISGLTPSITPEDLSKRLGTFGTVKALDGFGKLDALGDPRKYGYVTLETTKKQLGRCMNLLSGVTWKGARLRIGEARPDFRERIALEHEAVKRAAEEAAGGPPRKRRRLPRGVHGVHSGDMSLVTPENVAARGAWRVTPLGRIVRPIRMRPEHPLPDPVPATTQQKGKEKEKAGGKKKRARDPPTRARRKTIDPLKWGSQHLKGVFLDTGMVSLGTSQLVPPLKVDEQDDSEDDSSEDDESSENENEQEEVQPAAEVIVQEPAQGKPVAPTQKAPAVSAPSSAPTPASHLPPTTTDSDLRQEAQQSLGLLQDLFGDKEDEDWGGTESIGSGVEMDMPAPREPSPAVQENSEKGAEAPADAMEVDEEMTAPASELQSETPAAEPQRKPPAPVQVTKLKDLFAPREEDAGFSLLGHLDLDLDLELDDDEPTPSLPVQPAVQHQHHELPPALPAFDAKRALFFPVSAEERSRGRARDALDPTRWRTWFFRTDSAEETQKRWEETRGMLTSEWKRRHREAIKSRRRRGGGMGVGDAEA